MDMENSKPMIAANFAQGMIPVVFDQMNMSDKRNPKARFDKINAHQIISMFGRFIHWLLFAVM